MLTITTKLKEWDVAEITRDYVAEHDCLGEDESCDELTDEQFEKVVTMLTKDEKFRASLAKNIGKVITAEGMVDAGVAVLDYLPASHYNRILKSLTN